MNFLDFPKTKKKDKRIVLILKGLQGSGKTTYARKLVADGQGLWKRVNKDDIRAMVDNGAHSKKRESMVKAAEMQLIELYVKNGYHVVVDNTHLNLNHTERFRKHFGDLVELRELKIEATLEECLERDSKREKSVGKEVILNSYRQFILPEMFTKVEVDNALPKAVVFDMDGTLAKMHGRSPYDHTRVLEDLPNQDIVDLAKQFYLNDYEIIICSARKEVSRKDTEKWLGQYGIVHKILYMRADDDNRRDDLVKREFLEDIIRKYYIKYWIDDRDRVVDMLRASGITCLQVDYGNF